MILDTTCLHQSIYYSATMNYLERTTGDHESTEDSRWSILNPHSAESPRSHPSILMFQAQSELPHIEDPSLNIHIPPEQFIDAHVQSSSHIPQFAVNPHLNIDSYDPSVQVAGVPAHFPWEHSEFLLQGEHSGFRKMGSAIGVGELIDLLTGWIASISAFPSAVSTAAKERATMLEISRMVKFFMMDGNVYDYGMGFVCKVECVQMV